jgi:signal transduction histidine kinase
MGIGGRRLLQERLARMVSLLALLFCSHVHAAGAETAERVLVLYPTSDGQPGNFLFDRGLHALTHREMMFPGVPIVFSALGPPGSVVRYTQPSFWDLYHWHIVGVVSLCVIQALLIVGLLLQRASRKRAEGGLRDSQRELRALTGRLLQAQETERRRIARELHDDLNQGLAVLAVELDLLGQKPPESGAELGGRMHELSSLVKQLSSTVHDLSHNLHPSKLEQLGLVAAIRSLCKELNQGHDLVIEFTAKQVPPATPHDTTLCLYRIAQEALGNVVRHSGARHAGVELSGSVTEVFLRIVDDGVGFDLGSADARGGLGLVSMRERLHLVGGAITIDSQPSAGTCIDVRVPLSATSGEERWHQQLPGIG